jgi:hypothetical protein
VLVLTLAYPVQQYLAQQSQIAELERAQVEQAERIAALEERKGRWNDPAYVRAQARNRLQLVEPGEVAYSIQGGRRAPSRPDGTATGAVPRKGAWYGQLWSSVQAADKPAPVDAVPPG